MSPPENLGSRLSRLRTPQSVKRVDATALKQQAADAAKRGRRRLVLLIPAIAAVIGAYSYRMELFGVDKPVKIATAIALVLIAWPFASSLANVMTGRLQRVMEPGLIGVAGFLIKLLTLMLTIIASMRFAGLPIGTVALGASFTAVVVGLAAQQTLGNVLAGIVLLSARPFAVGDRIRFVGGGIEVEGVIIGHGLLYVTCADGEDHVLIPNNAALSMAIRPIREPAKVDMRARLPRDIDPERVEELVADNVSIATKGTPEVELEEYDGDEVVVRIKATPDSPEDGAKLAREVLGAVTTADRERTAA